MNAKLALWALLAGLLVGGMSGTAMAGQGFYYYGGVSPLAYPVRSYYVQQEPPYFALYPPVYYSYPVRRPYGLSPYAWPPVYHGDAVRSALHPARRGPAAMPERKPPKLIRNRFVSGGAGSGGAPQAETRKKPLRIVNQYVVRSDRATARDAEPGQPQVIYPAGVAGGME